MKYKRWYNLNLLEKFVFYLIISIVGAVFLLPLTITLIFLLKTIGVI